MLKKLSLLMLIIIANIYTVMANNNFDLAKSYNTYKQVYMSKDGRIIDKSKSDITTSEGQSYIMLRALAMNDETTFKKSYEWAKNNLQRQDKLFAWLWGKRDDKSWGIIDYNSASDADIDIALALIKGGEKWKKKNYISDGTTIAQSVWENETKLINNQRILMPGVKQTSNKIVEINPSYFGTYNFKTFKKYDKKHNWNELINSSYDYLEKLSTNTESGLFPDWFVIKNWKIEFENNKKSDFSYDAIRIFLRANLDYIYTKDKRALGVLKKIMFFKEKWISSHKIYSSYTKNGEIRNKDTFLGTTAVVFMGLNKFDKKIANKIYQQNIQPEISNSKYYLNQNSYYEMNLLWFSMYLDKMEK